MKVIIDSTGTPVGVLANGLTVPPGHVAVEVKQYQSTTDLVEFLKERARSKLTKSEKILLGVKVD